MAKRKQSVRIVYRGQADTYKIPGPSGAVYTFDRGVPVEVSVEDAPFFVEYPAQALEFQEPEEPAPVTELPPTERSSFEVAPEVEVAEPVSGSPEGTAEE
jgi:hypothetical protein